MMKFTHLTQMLRGKKGPYLIVNVSSTKVLIEDTTGDETALLCGHVVIRANRRFTRLQGKSVPLFLSYF